MRTNERVCFIGDSFVNGTGDEACLGWAGRLCAAARRAGHDVTYYNLGVRRETSADIASRWLREVLPRVPSGAQGRVVFSFGANDTAVEGGSTRLTSAESREALRRILSEAPPRFPTLMVGPPPVADQAHCKRIGSLSRAFEALCAEAGVPYLEVFQPLLALPAWRDEVAAGDGSHPGAGGYAALADLVAAWVPWREWYGEGAEA